MRKFSVEITDRDPRLEGCQILHTRYNLIWDLARIEAKRFVKQGWVSIYSQETGECMDELPKEEAA